MDFTRRTDKPGCEKAALLPRWMAKERVMVTVVKARVFAMFKGAAKVVKKQAVALP